MLSDNKKNRIVIGRLITNIEYYSAQKWIAHWTIGLFIPVHSTARGFWYTKNTLNSNESTERPLATVFDRWSDNILSRNWKEHARQKKLICNARKRSLRNIWHGRSLKCNTEHEIYWNIHMVQLLILTTIEVVRDGCFTLLTILNNSVFTGPGRNSV